MHRLSHICATQFYKNVKITISLYEDCGKMGCGPASVVCTASQPVVSLLLLLINFYFNWRLITLQYCSGFRHTFTWISQGCPCVPHPESPRPLPSPSRPSGSTQCTSPERPVSCIKPGLAIYFTYDNISFNAILSNHPTLTFSQSPKDCSLHLCLFCCLTYRVIITIFLNSIYMH